MLTNNQMVANRFYRWHQARQRVAMIVRHLEAGRFVYVCTMTKATRYKRGHAGMFKATRTGAWVQHGRKWANIDYCGIQVRA